jgi:ribulose-phosphate 3-epimerase
MSIICPSILTDNPHEYRNQIEKVRGFAQRIQIDLMDGEFTDSHSVNPIQVWWPDGLTADIHLMFKRPLEHLETLVSLGPNMVIIHAEAQGDIKGLMEHLQKLGIKAGICLLKDTQPEQARELISIADHVLIFSGNLGHFGGEADLILLNKIPQIKEINPKAEIGWDGGANDSNAKQLADGGIDVINVGGYIQKSETPQDAYATLVSKISN